MRALLAARRGLAALLLVLVATGCAVRVEGGPPRVPPGSIVVAQDVFRIDFRGPLTREEAGLAPGRDDRIYDRVGDAIDVEVTLPTGGVLRTDAFGVIVAGRAGIEEPELVTDLTLNVRTGTRAQTAAALLERADVLGIDPVLVEEWASLPETGRRAFNVELPRFVVSAEARPSSSGEDAWTVNYSLNHRPDGT